MKNDTIAAVSSPFGRGGIAVIRISGENAFSVAEKMFFPVSGLRLSELTGGKAVYGRIKSEGLFIDDGIATVFKAPHSYTGEDTVEISCHGGILLTQKVLQAAFDCGAVQAGAGEFTERAFLNGKIDLSGAEAVIGLIDAESEEQLRLCASHAQGVLKERCDGIYSRLLSLISTVYVKLDYPEEDLSEISDGEFILTLKEIKKMLNETALTYKQGRAVSEGVPTVIIGKPNVGKSSLLNALCGKEKAIVTAIPGTTRDIIEEKVAAGRIMLTLSDTAGIRSGVDEVEKIGVERARERLTASSLVIALFDTSRPLDFEDEEILRMSECALAEGKAVICVLSKSDTEPFFDETAITGAMEASKTRLKFCKISTVSGEGIETLKSLAEEFFFDGIIDYSKTAVIANARQYASVTKCMECVENAISAFENGMGADICGLDLEGALSAIGMLDGRSVTEEITSEIFHSFCVGK